MKRKKERGKSKKNSDKELYSTYKKSNKKEEKGNEHR